jgi:branched-chain amino acid transport system substrate-binding protein
VLYFSRALGSLVALGMSIIHLTASAAESGVSSNEVRIGASIALTGPLKALGESMRDGMTLYIDGVNRSGGINGRRINLVVLDDAYDVEKAKANTKRLIEDDKVFAIVGSMGTPAVLATLPIADAADVPFFAPFTGSDQVRQTKASMLYTINASYGDEVSKMLDHLKLLNIDEIAVLYQNNAFGKSGLQAAMDTAKKNGQRIVSAESVESNASNVSAATAAVAAKNPNALLIATAGKLTIDTLRAYQATGQRAQRYLLSVADVASLHGAMGESVRGIVVSQTLPPPWVATVPIIREYQKASAAAKFEKIDYTHLLGYMSAKAFTEALRRTGRDVTRDRFAAALQNSGRIDLGGYFLNFSRERQNGSSYVELTMLDKTGKFVR